MNSMYDAANDMIKFSAFDHNSRREMMLDDSLMDSFPASDPVGSFDFRTPPQFATY